MARVASMFHGIPKLEEVPMLAQLRCCDKHLVIPINH